MTTLQCITLSRFTRHLRERTVIINGVSKTYCHDGLAHRLCHGPERHYRCSRRKFRAKARRTRPRSLRPQRWKRFRGPQHEVDNDGARVQQRRDVIVEQTQCDYRESVVLNRKAHFTFFPMSGIVGQIRQWQDIASPCDFRRLLLEEAKVAGVPGEDFGSQRAYPILLCHLSMT